MSSQSSSLVWKFMLPIAGMLLFGVVGIALILPQSIKNIALQTAIENAEDVANQFKTIRGYYTKNVIAPAKASGMVPTYDHAGSQNAIPLPATMIHEVSKALETKGTEIKLYSPYPFPNRIRAELDDFQQSAWEAFQTNPDQVYYQSESIDGKEIVRVAVADTLQVQACVSCHNNHPETPKVGWKLNDVRGVLEIKTSLDGPIALANSLNMKIIAALTVGILTLLGIVFFYFDQVVSKPLFTLRRSLEDLAEGEADLSRGVPNMGNHEIGLISATFNQFQQNLRSIIVSLVTKSDMLKDASDELSNRLTTISNSSAQQSEEVTSCSTAITQINAVMNHMNDNSAMTSSSTADAQSEIDRSTNICRESIRLVNSFSADVSHTVTVVKELEDESANIGSVLDVISGIAEQTNLLALNAAIEAARAGDQGRGFAVVADEVRALAHRTGESTVEIQEMVTTLQNKARQACEGIEQTKNSTAQCVDTIKILEDNLLTFSSRIHDINQRSETNNEAMAQQSIAIDEMSSQMNNLSSYAESVTHSVEAIDRTADHVEDAADTIKNQLARFKT